MFSRAVRPPASWRRRTRFGAGVVLGQRASPQQFGVVVAEVLGVGHG